MARGGINKALVQKARQAILARGENPSIDAIRVELGNTGSKTTIHRYLKELEDADRGRNAAALPLSEQLANLVAQLADQLKEEAQADVAQEREQLARERLDYQNQIRQAESRIQQLEGQRAGLTEQFQAAQQALLQGTTAAPTGRGRECPPATSQPRPGSAPARPRRADSLAGGQA